MAEPICTDTELASALGDREALFSFLRTKLAWKVDPEDTFTYDESQTAGQAAVRIDLSQILPFSEGDPFVIFLVEFHAPFRRGDLREILRGVRRRIKQEAAYKNADLDELVFVCTLPDGLRFVHFEERENRQAKLRLFGFDRDTVHETYTLRTVNLSLLRLTTNVLGEVDWAACRANWKAAWDVEKVTKQFFRDYRAVFNDVEAHHVKNAPGDKRLFVQRFFNRLMFLHFLSRKDWLRAPHKSVSDSGKEYLHDLWNVYQARTIKHDNETFYRLHLAPLFFLALNEPYVGRNDELVSQLVGRVPYLNGGLFEQVDDDKAAFTIEDEAFTKIWDKLFSCYNFTVAESTPDDQDVAVDPEMLGKVFEELVTGRHESGSYYTPRPVVQFMCREALKGYLAPYGAGIEKLVDFHNSDEITNDEAVLAALKTVKVVDPACGSGAYLLGMMQELMALRLALFNKDARSLDAKTTYERKLEIIQNNLYGVDLDPFAVNTARLRLWLSLVVEDGRNALLPDANGNLPEVALPNLDFKIEEGDSITCPDPSRSSGNFSDEVIIKYEKAKFDHTNPKYHDDKTALKKSIGELRSEIAVWEGREKDTAFDWRVDFAGVFRAKEAVADLGGTLAALPKGGGFDIVLANPPYLSTKHGFGKDIRKQLSKLYKTAVGQFDAYNLFIERAFSLLKEKGHYVYIVPKPVLTNSSMQPVRAIMQENSVLAIADPGAVFEAAVEPIVIVGQKCRNCDLDVRVYDDRIFRGGTEVFVKKREAFVTPSGAWNASVTEEASSDVSSLKALPKLGEFFTIARGVECGKKDATIHKEAKNGRPSLLRGEDVEAFCVQFNGYYIDRGDQKIFKPLSLYKAGNVLVRRVTNHLVAAVDKDGSHVLNTLYVLQPKPTCPVAAEYLCALLNSNTLNHYFQDVFINDDKLFPYVRKEQLEQLPIALPNTEQEAQVISLVKMLSEHCDAPEQKGVLNALVAEIYKQATSSLPEQDK